MYISTLIYTLNNNVIYMSQLTPGQVKSKLFEMLFSLSNNTYIYIYIYIHTHL